MLKMLIADDEPVIIRGLQMLIDWAQLGIEICATCENGADALREIFAQSPDLALLDISMPGKTGIEILKALHTKAAPRSSSSADFRIFPTRTMPSATARWTIC